MKTSLRNAHGVPFLTLKGHVVVKNNQHPDGDTLSFAADTPFTKGRVNTNVPVDASGSKTVNVRLQSIDAPEKTQPWGAASRDALLRYFGFIPARLGLSTTDFTANGGTVKIPGWLATHGLDGNQRPLGYLFRRNPGFTHGREIPAEHVLKVLKHSANYAQVSSGAAYPAFYENTDETHAALFKKIADHARIAKRGVWALDTTTRGFIPTPDALGSQGALIYPKFFRRVTDWKNPKPNAKAFINWLKNQPDGKKRVAGAECAPIPLWRLFVVVNTKQVAVPYDVTKLWFSE